MKISLAVVATLATSTQAFAPVQQVQRTNVALSMASEEGESFSKRKAALKVRKVQVNDLLINRSVYTHSVLLKMMR